VLARWAGYTDSRTGQVALDVAPLFETVETLERAGEIITRLLGDEVYRAHLAARGDVQVVMVGYADSNKDSGILASRWLIRQAQSAMAEACAAAGVQLLVFHGRGGSISRGGSRTEAIARALPASVAEGRLRVTEQGESINDRYGWRPIAMRTFEQAFNTLALLRAGVFASERIEPRWLEATEVLAQASRVHYRSLVHDAPGFFEFFQAVTPVDVIERMQIGSRPVSRTGAAGVDAFRPLPWMFAWSQTRHMLPGWFGAGRGLLAVRERFGTEILGEMYARWPFFEGLVDDIEVRVARVDLAIAAIYEELAPEGLKQFPGLIAAEYELATEQLLSIKGCARLLDGDPTLQRSIRLRNPYVDPVHLTQVDLLARWREARREDRALFEALVASVNTIARAIQGAA
ncbi:MAG TPA: phosphoenolpyruvate carboxylase, partial [Steroidobacteraceae bacterium]|nr:phosphoenolpyruvate carboxylase [Steroidobacteraceae bacterium]